jgi:RNA polymerase primary sigma factor
MGLQRSTRRFDPERGYRFVVYASYWMRQAIMRWRADEGSTIRIPVHRQEKIARLDLAMDKFDVRADGYVSEKDLAAELEWTTDEVSQFRGFPREAVYPESIDDWDEIFPGEEDANAFDEAETEEIIADALAELPEREADIIRMRFGIDRESEMTLEEIGQIYGVTRERIRQIEAKGLDRLSHPGRKRRLEILLGRELGKVENSFPSAASQKKSDGVNSAKSAAFAPNSFGHQDTQELPKDFGLGANRNHGKGENGAQSIGPSSDDLFDRAMKMWSSGVNPDEIARELGVASWHEVFGTGKADGS